MELLRNITLLLFLTLIVFPCYGQDREVTVTSEGMIMGSNTMGARSQALTNAFRQAVEQGVGVLIQSNTIVQNFQLISDNIYSKSQGYVKHYEIIDEGQRSDSNSYFVTIRATVNMAEIGTDLRSLGILEDMVGNPKIMSLIQEVSMTSEGRVLVEDASSSIALEEELNKKNFELVDRAQVNKIRAQEMQRMGAFFMDDLFDDPDAIARIAQAAQEYGAQYLLMGNGLIESMPRSGGMFRAIATFKCKIVNASTAEKVALTQVAESGAGPNRSAADMSAGRRAGEVAAPSIIGQVIQDWSKSANEGVQYVIKLYGVTSYGRQGRKFMKAVRSIAGVTSCDKRLWDAQLGRLEMDVSFKGNSEDLIDNIFEVAGTIPGFEAFDMETQTGNNISFKVK